MLLLILYIVNALSIVFLCLAIESDDTSDSILHIAGYLLATFNGLWAAGTMHLIGGLWPKTFMLLVPNVLVSLFFAWTWTRRWARSNLVIKIALIALTFFNILAFFQ